MDEYFKVGDSIYPIDRREIFYRYSNELTHGWAMHVSDNRIIKNNIYTKKYSSLDILTLFNLDAITNVNGLSFKYLIMDRDEVAHNNTNINCNHIIDQLSEKDKFYDKAGNYIKDTAFYFDNLYTIQSLKFEFGNYDLENNIIPCRIIGEKNICDFEAMVNLRFTGYRFHNYDSVFEI